MKCYEVGEAPNEFDFLLHFFLKWQYFPPPTSTSNDDAFVFVQAFTSSIWTALGCVFLLFYPKKIIQSNLWGDYQIQFYLKIKK